MDKINIYAPTDGYVNEISKIDDDIFSKKLLGEGLFITPKSKDQKIELYSFFNEGQVSLLTETGHAIYLKAKQGPIGLMHIGLDSAKYNQKTFISYVKVQDNVNKKSLLISFDANFFQENKLRTEIPIVFDSEEAKEWKFEIIKKGNVKQGEIIASFKLQSEKKLDQEIKELQKNEKGDNKWIITAKNLINFVGENNFERVANCMTRTRFYVKNKDKVQIKKIENLETVKGITWSGNELQVVIGGNAYKVKDAVEKLMLEDSSKKDGFETKNIKTEKKTIWQRFLAAINGVIVPLMPLLISTGLILGISTILSNAGVIQSEPPEGGFVTDMDLWSGIIYILANTGLALLGIFFCYSTVKYLGGDPAIAILIGLILASRYFMRAGGESGEWHLFNIGNINVSIKAYNNNLLPAVAAGIMYFYTDKFIKKWMPGVIDILFRPILAITITVFLSFFLVAPILAIVEKGISIAAIWFYEIPYGFGGLILGLIWQPIVFLGMGWPVWLAIDADYFTSGGVLRGLPIMEAAALAMIGVVLAMAIKAKSKKEAVNAYASIMPLLFGITEPAMYGVTSPKGRPFWIACIGAGVSGMGLSLFGVTRESMGGDGILGILGHVDVKDMILYISFAALGLVVNFLLTWFFYSDKASEITLFKKARHKFLNYLNSHSQKNKNLKLETKKELETLNTDLKNLNQKSKLLAKQWVKLTKMQNTLKTWEEKNETKKAHIYDKMQKEMNKNLSKYAKLKRAYEKDNLKEKHTKLLGNISQVDQRFNLDLKNLMKLSSEVYKKTEKIITKNDLGNYQNQFKNLFYNAIFNTEIYIGNLDKKEDQISKKVIFNTENKFKLLVSF